LIGIGVVAADVFDELDAVDGVSGHEIVDEGEHENLVENVFGFECFNIR